MENQKLLKWGLTLLGQLHSFQEWCTMEERHYFHEDCATSMALMRLGALAVAVNYQELANMLLSVTNSEDIVNYLKSTSKMQRMTQSAKWIVEFCHRQPAGRRRNRLYRKIYRFSLSQPILRRRIFHESSSEKRPY